jgi:hypothetical protein
MKSNINNNYNNNIYINNTREMSHIHSAPSFLQLSVLTDSNSYLNYNPHKSDSMKETRFSKTANNDNKKNKNKKQEKSLISRGGSVNSNGTGSVSMMKTIEITELPELILTRPPPRC